MSTTTSLQNDDINNELNDRFKAIEETLDKLSSLDSTSRLKSLDEALHSLSDLSGTLTETIRHLPSYDQRQHTTRLSDVSMRVAHARQTAAPKKKFSFKSRKATSGPSSTIGGDIAPTPAAAPLNPSVPATDGQVANLTISGRKEELLRVKPDAQGASLLISDIEDSVVVIEGEKGAISSAAAKNIRRSVIIIGDSLDGPMHITGMENSVLVLKCRQLRMHEARDTDVYLWCASSPIVEDCTAVRFGPFTPDGDDNTETETETDGEGGGGVNLWYDVKDFKWLREEASPNWRLLIEDEWVSPLTEGRVEGCTREEVLERFIVKHEDGSKPEDEPGRKMRNKGEGTRTHSV